MEWESYPVPPPGKKDTEIAVLLPASKHTKIFVHEQPMLGKKLSMKRKDTEFFVVKSEFFLLFSILIFPYVLGFLLCYILFYFYGGMTIESFLEMQQLHLQIEFWCIGAYLFVTTGVIWFVFKSLVSFFKKEYS